MRAGPPGGDADVARAKTGKWEQVLSIAMGNELGNIMAIEEGH